MANKMENINGDNHPILNVVLGLIAVITGASSGFGNITVDELDYYDKLMAVILKGVSIISFLLIVVLNLNRVIKLVKDWFKTKKDV
jgi:hypothetical protein